jgi:hypothetical protein
MQDKIRQWFVDNPQAMNAAYLFILSSSVLLEIGTREASGGSAGP